jgi:hypothetical protein
LDVKVTAGDVQARNHGTGIQMVEAGHEDQQSLSNRAQVGAENLCQPGGIAAHHGQIAGMVKTLPLFR